ncbi:MAG: glycerol-3-phosphate 1-O-acyltransferase PlsY [Spirochaetia bacterium]|nr:glycerol-3-phosphate 1-O-acyltransferase PlsY [Spirochaetia bacterium]
MKNLAAVITLSYLIGAVPFGYLAGKVFKGIDIRGQGSGNSGATNAFRVLGKKTGIAVLLLDFLKGVFCVLVISRLDLFSDTSLPLEYVKLVSFASAFIGHIYPVYLGFKGGKGVAVAAGGASALSPVIFPVCAIVFSAVLVKTRYVSAASLSAAWALVLVYPLSLLSSRLSFNIIYEAVFITAAFFVTYKHRSNIARLIKKNENRIG